MNSTPMLCIGYGIARAGEGAPHNETHHPLTRSLREATLSHKGRGKKDRLISPKQRAVILQDHPRGVVAWGAGDAAAGMGAGAAMIQAFERSAVIGVAQHWPRREQLVQRQRAVKNIAAQETEVALEVERRY